MELVDFAGELIFGAMGEGLLGELLHFLQSILEG